MNDITNPNNEKLHQFDTFHKIKLVFDLDKDLTSDHKNIYFTTMKAQNYKSLTSSKFSGSFWGSSKYVFQNKDAEFSFNLDHKTYENNKHFYVSCEYIEESMLTYFKNKVDVYMCRTYRYDYRDYWDNYWTRTELYNITVKSENLAEGKDKKKYIKFTKDEEGKFSTIELTLAYNIPDYDKDRHPGRMYDIDCNECKKTRYQTVTLKVEQLAPKSKYNYSDYSAISRNF